MIQFENTITPSPDQWQTIIMGARNPLNSWARSDSGTCDCFEKCFAECKKHQCEVGDHFYIGPNDLSLMMKLRNAGTDHRKFMRMIVVYTDITAPLYWWKEFSTYKVGTVANSCSTMHKIHAKEFSFADFSCEYLGDDDMDPVAVSNPDETYRHEYTARYIMKLTIDALNNLREKYNIANDRLRNKELSDSERKHILAQRRYFWYNMIQLLPTSYNQKRTVMLNYEVLANIYKSRKNHKLDEWHMFCDWIETLPYAYELIVGEENANDSSTVLP